MLDPVSGRDEIADLWVVEGRIVERAPRLACTELDARGKVVAPGLIDLHVHFREPGGEEAETIASGSQAAARGGFTTVVTMPNTTPPTDSPERVREALRLAEAAGRVRVLPSACITRGRQGREVAPLSLLAAAGAAAFTDDGATVPDAQVMAEAMREARRLDALILDHALDPALSGPGVMHAGRRAKEAGLPGIPSQAESEIVARDIRLARETACRTHIQHVSAAESVDLIRRARAEGVPVSGEATPHHLALCDDDLDPADANYKMSPPLRGAADRDALRAAVCDGTLAALATDHAPHPAAAKARGFRGAPFGIVGLETAVGVTYTLLVKELGLPLLDWLRLWTAGPAEILRRPLPSLGAGAPADVVLLDCETEWTVRAAEFASRSRNTPFEGWRLRGRAAATLCAGRLTWPE